MQNMVRIQPVYSYFGTPPERDLEWSDQGVEGSFRFLNRIWRLVTESYQEVMNNDLGAEDTFSGQDKELRYVLHNTIKRLQRILVNGSTLIQPSALLWSWSMQPMTIWKRTGMAT